MDITKEQYIEVIKQEIEVLESRIQRHDTGHIITAIEVLRHRIKELKTDPPLDSQYPDGDGYWK